MAQTKKDTKTSEFLVTVEKAGSSWKKEIKGAEDHLLKNVSIKGFRKGKAPRNLALKQISKAEVFSHAVSHVLKGMADEASKELPKDLLILDAPSYLVKDVNDQKVEITFIYPIYPEVVLADYKKHGIKYTEEKVDDKVIKQELEKVTASKTSKEIKEGVISKGDVANFDFEGFVNGKPFDNGKAEKFELEIGSGQFIPGFEDQMIGLKKDDSKDIKVTFPKEYQDEKLKGKPATFKVKINEVFEKKTPKLTNALVKELGIKDVDTIDKLKTYIKDVFILQNTQKARAAFQREVFDKLLKNSKFTIPASLISKEMQQVGSQIEANLKQQNISMDQYMKFTGQNREQVNSEIRKQAEQRLNDSFIFAEIAKREKIEFKEEDYENEYKKLAKIYQTTEDGVKGMINKQQMQIPMTNDRVIDILVKISKQKKKTDNKK